MVKICLQCRTLRFNPWVRKIPWRKKWQPTPEFLPGKSHGERSLAVTVQGVTEFQRIARIDKKALFSNQCKEIEENNRMGKTRDLFKKIRDTKATFHAKMGSIKDRNGMDLTEAEDIKKRWQENTEELYKKDLHDPDNNDGVITHLEPDILECEVKYQQASPA